MGRLYCTLYKSLRGSHYFKVRDENHALVLSSYIFRTQESCFCALYQIQSGMNIDYEIVASEDFFRVLNTAGECIAQSPPLAGFWSIRAAMQMLREHIADADIQDFGTGVKFLVETDR